MDKSTLKLGIDIDRVAPEEAPKAWSTVLKNKTVYKTIQVSNIKPTCIEKWRNRFPGHDINWENVFTHTYKLNDAYLRWFEMKILHRILPTQKLLHNMGLVASPICDFCENEVETILHLMWECPFTRLFWNRLSGWISSRCPKHAELELDIFSIMFLEIETMDPILHLIIALAKNYIFKCKTNRSVPNLRAFRSILSQRYSVEKYRNQKRNAQSEEVFEDKWKEYESLM